MYVGHAVKKVAESDTSALNRKSCFLYKARGILIIIIMNDIYPGSSTHSKVVFREVLHPIELE